MWDLVKIENRKSKMIHEVLAFIIINAILYSMAIFSNIVGYESGKGFVIKGTSEFQVYNLIMALGCIVVIYGGFIFYELFNEEFEANLMKVNYLFPQGRKKIITAKVLVTLIDTVWLSIGAYITQTIVVLATRDILGMNKEAFNLSKFIENIPNLILVILISLLLVFLTTLIGIVIKSTTFNVFSILLIGVVSTILTSYFIEVLVPYSKSITISVLFGCVVILVLAFINILKIEMKKDI